MLVKDSDSRLRTTGRRPAARFGRRIRGLVGGGLGFGGIVAILILAAPLTSGFGPVTFTAPYTGFTAVPVNYTAQSGCAHESQSALPTWNPSTGGFAVASSVTAGKCAGSNVAQAYSAVELFSPAFLAPAPGFGYVSASISSAFSAHASLHLAPPGNASNGTYVYGESSVYLSVAIFVNDVTHGNRNVSLFGYATDTLVSQFFTSSGSFALTTSWTNSSVYATGQFNRGHWYQVQIEITASIFAVTYGGGSLAGAALNVAGTNGLSIASLVAA
jgi:hypothetical protein